MTEAMPFLQKIDITFLRPPTIAAGAFLRRQTGKLAFGPRPCGVHTAAVDS